MAPNADSAGADHPCCAAYQHLDMACNPSGYTDKLAASDCATIESKLPLPTYNCEKLGWRMVRHVRQFSTTFEHILACEMPHHPPSRSIVSEPSTRRLISSTRSPSASASSSTSLLLSSLPARRHKQQHTHVSVTSAHKGGSSICKDMAHHAGIFKAEQLPSER